MRGDPARERRQQPDQQGADRARGLPVEGYALTGDGHAAGLAGQNGPVDWLCLPRFDFGACFGALLGTEEHGFWRIAPTGAAHRVVRRYRGETLVLETEFHAGDGVVRLVDCMTRRSDHPALSAWSRGSSAGWRCAWTYSWATARKLRTLARTLIRHADPIGGRGLA